jgi:hypothetical protein
MIKGENMDKNNTTVLEKEELESLASDLKIDTDTEYKPLTLSNWFFTFMCMNIPVIGLFYLLILSFGRRKSLKKDFARAYLLYQVIFITIAVVLVGIFCYFGLEVLDNVLKFMQEL